jgi:DNA polymerase-1
MYEYTEPVLVPSRGTRTFPATLGGEDVAVYAPEPGRLGDGEREAFALLMPPGALYGLDMESTAMGPAGPWAPGWRMRRLQVATEAASWVLDVERDPEQWLLARDFLADERNTFTSHMDVDACAVWVTFGVDITARFLDTHPLAIMCNGHQKGVADLKTQAARHGMGELVEADKALDVEFDELYRRDHPVDEQGRKIGKRAIKGSTLAAYGFTNVDGDSPRYLTYAGLDAVAVRRLAPMLLRETRAPASLLDRERWLAGQAARIRIRGHRVDVERLDELRRTTGEQVVEIEAELADATGRAGGLKPTQDKALKDFWTAAGADWRNFPLTKTGGVSLAKDNVKLLRTAGLSGDALRAAEAYIAYQSIRDRLTRTEQIAAALVRHGANDWRIHAQLHTVGTVTGRMSASDPNMQNFKKRDPLMRGLFLPDEGHAFVSTDFAQIELRVLAALAREQAMIDVIASGGDLHQLTADLLGITRDQAKTVNFLIVYGGGGGKLAAGLGIPVDEARAIVRSYWAQYPSITGYKQWAEMLREVELLSGRRVSVDADRAYANLNYLIQGNARELLVGAWWRLVSEYGWHDAVWFPVHDELVTQAPEDQVDRLAADTVSCMTFDFLGVPVAADADVLIDEHGTSRWMAGDVARKLHPRCDERFAGRLDCARLDGHAGEHDTYATLGELRAGLAVAA